MEHEDFADVQWASTPHDNTDPDDRTALGAAGENRPSNAMRVASADSTHPGPDPLDYAGVGNAVLECTVSQPLKENDGSKDAYVSYLVTTNVCTVLCLTMR